MALRVVFVVCVVGAAVVGLVVGHRLALLFAYAEDGAVVVGVDFVEPAAVEGVVVEVFVLVVGEDVACATALVSFAVAEVVADELAEVGGLFVLEVFGDGELGV